MNSIRLKTLVIVIILTPSICFAQGIKNIDLHLKDPSKENRKDDLKIYLCQFLAGSADGVNQALVHHYLGMGTRFWDFQTSWKNKYKDYDAGDLRPAFIGSKWIFVGFTDGYHLTRTIDRTFTTVSFALALKEKNSFKQIIKKVLLSTAVNRAGFLLFFNVIFPRRGGGLNR
jgi:hypothetical protein